MALLRSELRAEDYRARARDALIAAEASCLDRAREQHERAAAAWTELAEAEDRRSALGRLFLGTSAAPITTQTLKAPL